MMMRTRRAKEFASVLLLLIFAVACGDDDASKGSAFAGTYQVVSHTRSAQNCESEGDAFSGDKFFELREAGGAMEYYRCTSPEACTGPDQSRGFDNLDGDAWKRIEVSVEQYRETCEVQLSERVASFVGEETLRIEGRVYSGSIPHELDQACDEQFVLANRDALSCGQRDIVKARRAKSEDSAE